SKKPAAMAYLDAIGVAKTAVRGIVVSHWHEDHVRGIDRLIAQYTDARVFVPSAFHSTQLYKLVKAGNVAESLGTDALRTSRSFSKALDVLKKQDKMIVPTQADKLIFAKSLAGFGDIRVTALSPSVAAQLLALADYTEFVTKDLPLQKRPIARDPNLT